MPEPKDVIRARQVVVNSVVGAMAPARPCIIELLAQAGPGHRGTVAGLCVRETKEHIL